MKTYAKVDKGVVTEIITPTLDLDGVQYALEACFPAEFVLQCVDIADLVPQPEQRWIYDGQSFFPEPEHIPTPAEILASNTSTRDALLVLAAAAIAPLQDAVDLDDATAAETALLKKWKQYRVAVNRIDLTAFHPVWPVTPA